MAHEYDNDDAISVAAADDDSDAPVELDGKDVRTADGDLRAQNVTLSQGGAGSIEADTVSISQGGAGRVHAGQMSVSQGGVGLARVEHLTIEQDGSAFALMADEATVDDGANVFLLVAGKVSGNIKPLVDWRSAAAFGAGLALVLTLLRKIR